MRLPSTRAGRAVAMLLAISSTAMAQTMISSGWLKGLPRGTGFAFAWATESPASAYYVLVRRITLLLIVCLVFAATSTSTAHAAALGLAVDQGFIDAGSAALPAARLLSVTYVRVDVRWNDVAPTTPSNARLPGNKAYAWSLVDSQVKAGAAIGAQVILSIGGTPDWARADRGVGGSPGDPAWMPRRASWQNFMAAVVARYSGRFRPDGVNALPAASAFEVWPQPNLAAGLRPQRLAGRLVAPGLLKVLTNLATLEVRKVSTTGVIVSGGLARTDPASTVDTPSITFLRGMARTRMAFDAVGLRLVPAGGIEALADSANLSITDANTIATTVDSYWPGLGKPIWLTGYGLPSGPSEAGLTPETQAAGVGSFLAAAANPRIGLAIWNSLAATSTAPSIGLLGVASAPNTTGSVTPAWTMWITLVPPPGV